MYMSQRSLSFLLLTPVLDSKFSGLFEGALDSA